MTVYAYDEYNRVIDWSEDEYVRKDPCPTCGSQNYPEPDEVWDALGAWYTSQCVLCHSRLIHLVWGADVDRVTGEITPHDIPGLVR